MGKIQNVGVLTSGGDAPGMNAAIRAVVRACIYNGLNIFGIRHGYHGMIFGQIKELKSHDVANMIQRGGTMLKTARSKEFQTEEGMKTAYESLKKHDIQALIVIGGDGSFRGALEFGEKYDIPCIGIPGTIDNDIFGTDDTIGFDTALNTVIEAVDKIRDTASSHERLFFVEVMGRDAGFIALRSGIACGAEAILIPEVELPIEKLRDHLECGHKRKKSSNIILVAEGEKAGGAFEIAKKVEKDFHDYDVRVTVLGHIQRGGSPSAYDRFLASRMGISAVEALLENQKSIMIGIQNQNIVYVPLSKAVKTHKPVDPAHLQIVEVLNV
jgi:6-phosphofructokinase 1